MSEDTRAGVIRDALEFYDENPRDREPMEAALAALDSLLDELAQFRAKLHTFGSRANLEHNRAERLERELGEAMDRAAVRYGEVIHALEARVADAREVVEEFVRWHDTDGGPDPTETWQTLIDRARAILRGVTP